MFEAEFPEQRLRPPAAGTTAPASWRSSLARGEVARVQMLYWREHCLECAPPDCYNTCKLYVARSDRRCARFQYGIFPNPAVTGLQGFGAEIKFRKWGKLGTVLYGGTVSPALHNGIARLDRWSSAVLRGVYRVIRPINICDLLKIKPWNPQRFGYKAFAFAREKLFALASSMAGARQTCDTFVLECFSFEPEEFTLLVEHTDEVVRSRHAIRIKPGHNYREIALKDFNGTANPLRGSVNLCPENDREVRVAFTWLDFVKKKAVAPAAQPEKAAPARAAPDAKPADKVKCLVWDLDNTVWKGVLIEDGRKNLVLRDGVADLIKALDARGIIQSVVSKNDSTEALEALAGFGLREYFVQPAINWEPKSRNLRRVATALNINVDTLALIDDSPFERAEVASELPQCRVYDEKQVGALLGRPEFDVPVTEESRMRRLSYIAEQARETSFKEAGGDYSEFLRSCRMEMRIFAPREPAHVERCLELIQRSNQLNLSTRRYGEAEFREMLATPGMLCVAFHCQDRFGDYGLVGFASLDERGAEPRLVDLVISCRVAQKMVERTLLEWFAERAKARGHRVIQAELKKTKKNGPLRAVFETLPFTVVEDTAEVARLTLPLEKMDGRNDVVRATVTL